MRLNHYLNLTYRLYNLSLLLNCFLSLFTSHLPIFPSLYFTFPPLMFLFLSSLPHQSSRLECRFYIVSERLREMTFFTLVALSIRLDDFFILYTLIRYLFSFNLAATKLIIYNLYIAQLLINVLQ